MIVIEQFGKWHLVQKIRGKFFSQELLKNDV